MKIPFVGLHAHSTAGSPFDAVGYPQDHMDYAYENGMDALALTDHGNMNGLAFQVLHAKKMEKEGKSFKPIYGIEAYFVPSLEEWRGEYEEVKNNSKKMKKEKDSGTTIEDEGASKKSVKDILRKRAHLILLAQNQKGLNNLFKLVSKSFSEDNFYRYPRVDYKLLAEHNEGIMAASACLGGVYAQDYWKYYDGESKTIPEENKELLLNEMRTTSKRMKETFGDRWYAELQWNSIKEQLELNEYIIQVAKEFDIELISTADSHYPRPDVWKDRELYKRLAFINKGNREGVSADLIPKSVEEVGYELYPKNGEQMWNSYKSYSSELGFEYDDDIVMDSITRTHKIAHERVEKFYPDNSVRLPGFVIPQGKTADEALTQAAITGLQKKYEDDLIKESEIARYAARLKEELSIINNVGFEKYFLTMKAIADKAQEIQLAGPGRGSAAGSLVAYALDITQIDPIKYGLLFSRFLRKDAVDYPDIDYDVSDPMVLKEKLVEEWGEDCVAPISNWNTLKLKSLIKDIARFYNIDFSEVNTVTSKMMDEAKPRAKERHGLAAGMYIPTFEEVKEFSPTLQNFLNKYPYVETHIDVLHGQIRSCSRHAGGVVVAENLSKHMPLIKSGGVIQTPWSEGQNVRHLEPMGFIKFDILGLTTLRMMEGAIRHILKRHHGKEDPSFKDVKEYYDENLHPNKIDLNDQEVYKNVFHKGKWAGIFQFTESGAQKLCEDAKPTNIIDISTITSIYRPGPLSAGVGHDYIKARENPEEVVYENKVIEEVTRETHGFLIFQEQIALLAHRLGKDFSLDEGNLLRKVLTKKGTGKDSLKDNLKIKFVEGCLENNLSRGEAENLWTNFEYFSGYGFNKSHAVSYSVLSYQCAWLSNYYETEWMAAFLDKEPETRKEKATNLAKSFGFKIKNLDVNTSGKVWEISEDGKTLIQPLTSIKGLGEKAIEQIIDNRPYNSVEEFIFNENIVYSKLNKKALDVLIRSQAMNELADDRFTGLKHFWTAVAVHRPRKEKDFLENIAAFAQEGDFTEEEKIEYLVSLTGFFPISKVLNHKVRSLLEQEFVPPISEYDPELGNVWFIPRKITVKKTKKGKDYWVVDCIDDNSNLTKVKCWAIQPNQELHINRPYIATLDYDAQWGFSTRSIRKNFVLLD